MHRLIEDRLKNKRYELWDSDYFHINTLNNIRDKLTIIHTTYVKSGVTELGILFGCRKYEALVVTSNGGQNTN